RVALSGTHPGLGGLLGHGFVREDVDPHLPAPADVASDGHTGRLDLAVGDPPGLQGQQAEVAEVDLRATLGLAAHPAALHLAVPNLLRGEHQASVPSGGSAAGSAGVAVSADSAGVGSLDALGPGSVGLGSVGSASAGSASAGSASGASAGSAGATASSSGSASASSFTSVI